MSRIGNNIYKRKDGRWEGRYIKGYNAGKTLYGYVYAKTYQDVKEKLQYAKRNPKNITSTTNKVTFNEVSSQWLCSITVRIKESTYARYAYLLRQHITPCLGHYRMADITNYTIDIFTKDKLKHGKINEEGGLSPKTVKDILSIVKSILSYGQDYINLNTFAIAYPKSQSQEMRVLSRDEQTIFESVLSQSINISKLGMLICLYTGIRIGELCALSWNDISLTESTISVKRTIQRVCLSGENKKRTKVIIDTPKSQSSVRNIPIPNFIVDKLVHFKAENTNVNFLTNIEDKYMEPRTFQYRFKCYIKESGIPPANFHCLRHTFATRCIEAGFDIKSLSEILGHATVNITLNRYVHSSFELKQKNMEKLERLYLD